MKEEPSYADVADQEKTWTIEKVYALSDAGMIPADIAIEIGITPKWAGRLIKAREIHEQNSTKRRASAPSEY